MVSISGVVLTSTPNVAMIPVTANVIAPMAHFELGVRYFSGSWLQFRWRSSGRVPKGHSMQRVSSEGSSCWKKTRKFIEFWD